MAHKSLFKVGLLILRKAEFVFFGIPPLLHLSQHCTYCLSHLVALMCCQAEIMSPEECICQSRLYTPFRIWRLTLAVGPWGRGILVISALAALLEVAQLQGKEGAK